MQLKRLGDVRLKVGEGPVWDVEEQALFFVDVLGQSLGRHRPADGSWKRWDLPQAIGAMALRADGAAMVALADGLHVMDLSTGRTTLHAALPSTGADVPMQSNDGKVDPAGRFLVGTVPQSLHEERPLGALIAIEPDGTTRALDTGFAITNGPAWSSDGRRFWFASSRERTIYLYDYDAASGVPSGRRVFARTDALGGMPDGATVDAEGRLWVAICGGGCIAVFEPDGRLARRIEIPTPLVGSVMFGGPALDRLYVTTLDPGSLGLGMPGHPLGGALFEIEGLGVRGLPERRFGA